MSKAIIKAFEERQRQISKEGFDATRDDQYIENELTAAALCYVAVLVDTANGVAHPHAFPALTWPRTWDRSWWKPSHDPKRNIEKAMALLAAEYDRIERAEEASNLEEENQFEVWGLNDSDPFKTDDLSELISDHDLEAGSTVYVGMRSEQLHGSTYCTGAYDAVTEQMQAAAEGDVGELAEDYPDVTPSQGALLEIFIDAWADAYCKPSFYLVENVREYVITAEDVEASQ
ncbi:hypothetical protein [Halomonas sp. Mc5H-6]|uniref:hypothetical protein n=1 Tax=Halomonas sp. Mc5H-6 TaxID=2954500 RepID=UPI0020971964|nr:hypothetical protein [Halomonas sp. Mc5H-6]MCO7246414.1 hypothetical protein [Halomonas sp. Mc5H-6]